jgi:hypothetical protein
MTVTTKAVNSSVNVKMSGKPIDTVKQSKPHSLQGVGNKSRGTYTGGFSANSSSAYTTFKGGKK